MTTKGIDDFANSLLVDAKCMGLRRVSRKDLKRISKLTGGRILYLRLFYYSLK
jgi:chaperonin GroEL (HSP60 family)